MSLPSTDYISCTYLIPERVVRSSTTALVLRAARGRLSCGCWRAGRDGADRVDRRAGLSLGDVQFKHFFKTVRRRCATSKGHAGHLVWRTSKRTPGQLEPHADCSTARLMTAGQTQEAGRERLLRLCASLDDMAFRLSHLSLTFLRLTLWFLGIFAAFAHVSLRLVTWHFVAMLHVFLMTSI